MTLILSCATQEYVVQVSDRRLTRGAEIVDDDANKAVLFCGRMAFAYTGLAEIDGKRTDEWLTKILTDPACVSLSDACKAICTRATECFRAIHHPRELKRHAFVGVGWTDKAGAGLFEPMFCRISNFYNEKGQCLDRASDEFRMEVCFLKEPDFFALSVAGQYPSTQEQVTLQRNLQRGLHRQLGPQGVCRLLATTIRDVASRVNAVGRNLLATSLPKIAVERMATSGSFVMTASVPNREGFSFLYIPAGQTDGTQYGPNFVCGGGGLTNVETGPLPSA